MPPNIQVYFLTGDRLTNFIRKEFGMVPMERTKEYADYLRDARIRRAKSEGLKRLARTNIQLTH